MKSVFPYPVFLVVVACMCVVTALNSLHAYYDFDTWWHLRVGKEVWQSGDVPTTDPISRHGIENQVPWRAYSWLHEVILYHVHTQTGIPGLMWYKTLLTALSTAIVMGFVLWRTQTTFFGILCAAGVGMLVYPMGTERPWHFTIAFTTFTLIKAIQLRDGGGAWRAWWLVPMFIIWANTHIQFVLGWGILGLAFLFPGRANRWPVGGVLAACILAVLVNPYHFGLFQVIWEYATQRSVYGLVQELSAPSFSSPFTIIMRVLFAAAAYHLFAEQRKDYFEIGLLLAGAYFANKMFRDLWFGGLVVAAVLHSPSLTRATTKQILGTMATVLTVYTIVRLAFVLGLIWFRSNDIPAKHEQLFPVKAAEYLKHTQPPGPLFNGFNWGGYLSWSLPEYPVSLDGRTNLYGPKLLHTSWATWDEKDAWRRDETFLKSNIVISEVETVLAKELLAMPDVWQLAYQDETAFVFLRK